MRNNQSRTGSDRPVPPSPAPAQSNLAYVVPTEFVELPSRGRFYPEGHPLCGQETVEIKYMTAKEEDILSSTALLKKGLALERLLDNLIVEDIDPAGLLLGDRNAIMIAARISSYGRGYNVKGPCPNCETKVEQMFDLEDSSLIEKCFEQKFLDESNVRFDEEQKTFVVTLPVSNIEVSVRMLVGKDEKELMESDEARSVTSLLSAIISSAGGDHNQQVVASFVESMPAADSKFLRDIYSSLSPNISLKQEFICAACFHKQEMEVPLTAEFFWPE